MAIETVSRHSPQREELSSRFSWSAIFAGAFITLGIQLLFNFLGSSIGLSTIDPEQGQGVSNALVTWSAIYLGVTLLISFFVGGYAASRFSGQRFKLGALMHGVASWALVTVFVSYLMGSAITSAFTGVFSSTTGIVSGVVSGATQGAAGLAGRVSPQIRQRILSGNFNRNDMVTLLSRQLKIPRSQASNLVNQISQGASSIDPGRIGTQVAGEAVDIAAATSWVSFIAVTIALAGTLGGAAVALRGPASRRADLSVPDKVDKAA